MNMNMNMNILMRYVIKKYSDHYKSADPATTNWLIPLSP